MQLVPESRDTESIRALYRQFGNAPTSPPFLGADHAEAKGPEKEPRREPPRDKGDRLSRGIAREPGEGTCGPARGNRPDRL